MTDELKQIFLDFPSPTGEDFGKPGWVYRDLPLMLVEYWEDLMGIFELQNVQLLAMTHRRIDNIDYARGQILISPAGMENLKAYNNAR